VYAWCVSDIWWGERVEEILPLIVVEGFSFFFVEEVYKLCGAQVFLPFVALVGWDGHVKAVVVEDWFGEGIGVDGA
jgi:hypothetical protein